MRVVQRRRQDSSASCAALTSPTTRRQRLYYPHGRSPKSNNQCDSSISWRKENLTRSKLNSSSKTATTTHASCKERSARTSTRPSSSTSSLCTGRASQLSKLLFLKGNPNNSPISHYDAIVSDFLILHI